MQLILHTDTNIGVQKKMSTIEQESLDEKFINTSVIGKVCIDIAEITNGNDDCVKSQEVVVKINENNLTTEEQPMDTSDGFFVNDKNNEESETGSDIFSKESSESKEHSQLENQENNKVGDKNGIQGLENSEKEENMDMDVDIPDIFGESSNKDDKEKEDESSEIINKIEVHVKKNCEVIDKRGKTDEEKSEMEDKMEVDEEKHEVENRIDEQGEQKSEMKAEAEEEDKDSVGMEDKFEEQVKGEILMREEIGEQDKRKSEIQNEFEEQDEDNFGIEDKQLEEQNKEKIEIGDKVLDEEQDNCGIEDNIGDEDKEKTEIENTKQDKDNCTIEETEDKFEEQDNEKIETGDKIDGQDIEKSEIEHIMKEQDVVICRIENKLEKQEKEKIEIENKIGDQDEENSGITNQLEVPHNDNCVILDTFGKQNKEKKEIELNSEKQHNGNCEIEDKFEEQDKDESEIRDKIVGHDKDESEMEDKIKGQDKEESEMEDKIEGQDKEESEMEDKIEGQDKEKIEMEDKIEGQDKEDREMGDEIEGQDNEESQMGHEIERQAEDEGEMGDKIEGKDKEESKLAEKTSLEICRLENKFQELDKERSKIEDKLEKQDKMNSDELKEQVTMKECGVSDNTKESDVIENEIEERSGNDTEMKTSDEKKIVGSLESIGNKSEIHIDEVAQNVEKPADECEQMKDCVEKEGADDDNMIIDMEGKPNFQHSEEVNSQNVLIINSETENNEVENAEIIDIADEKDEDSENIISQDMQVIEKEPEKYEKEEASKTITESLSKSDDQEMEIVTSEENKDIEINDKPTLETSVLPTKGVESLKEKEQKPVAENVEEKKKLTHICKLSNTLDILSDEDEDTTKEEPQQDISTVDKCIDIEDDDDIMLIDEESSSKDSKNKVDDVTQPHEENKLDLKEKDIQSLEISTDEKDTLPAEVGAVDNAEIKTTDSKEEVTEQEENQVEKKPLLPVNFLKTCKKNLADMTREELEEFCILKIVESVVDRSNLSEIKSQLKSMTQNMEEYRKKMSILTKQNRDFNVVLKSVQEEQKKKSNMPITPLKITRSVGMQVLMTDKSGARRKPAQGPNTLNNAVSNNVPNRQGKGQMNQNSRIQKIQTNTMSPIPVPRLVPALNNCNINNMKIQPPNANTPGKSQATGPISSVPIQSVSNGLPAISPTPKPEKRPHSRMQQVNSVTVDLTDDEPPAKVAQRNVTPPVRLVPPQNLLAPHRQPFGTNINSPRKVYIPISGSQNQGVGARPGQTIMLKTISPQGPRQRCPPPAIARPNQGPNTVRMQRMPSRHPAPLPDSIKQYQPLNWKALPPAPELKLSKVDNGIVISWKIDGYQEDNHEEIASYQLYAYQETSSPPSTTLWKKIGDVKALPLPMACTLTQFMAGYKYYFAVRAVDVRSRLGPFSLPGSILLLNKV